MAKDVPIIKYKGKLYFFDSDKQVLINVEDMVDVIPFSSVKMENISEI